MTTSIPPASPDTSALPAAPGGAPAAAQARRDGLRPSAPAKPGRFDDLLAAPAAEAEPAPEQPADGPPPAVIQVTLGRENLFVRGQVALAATDEDQGALIAAGGVEEAGEAEATGEVAAPEAPEETPAPKGLEDKRELLELVAALLASLLPVLPPPEPTTPQPETLDGAAAQPSGAENGAVDTDPPAPAAPKGPVVVVKLPDQPAMRFSLPTLQVSPDVSLGQALGQLQKKLAKELTELFGDDAEVQIALTTPAIAPADASEPADVELEVELPATGLADEALANFAAEFRAKKSAATREEAPAEKNFLSAKAEQVKPDKAKAGIGVAESDADMAETFTAHRYTTDQQVFPAAAAGREVALSTQAAPTAAPAAPVAAVPAGVLAQRTVETIRNVVDAQRSREADAAVVNLHFKFAGEDLAVRVQLRGGEVHTQFRTDSAELRAALASEWRAMAGQGSESGVRLIAPVFSGSGASGQNGFGSAPHGQSSFQQHAQQQAQGPAILPELRALRRGAGAVSAAPDSAPRSAAALPTSHHLTAFA